MNSKKTAKKSLNDNIGEVSKEVEEATARDIIDYLVNHLDVDKRKLTAIKGRFCKKHGFKNVIKDSKIREYATEDELEDLDPILKRRKTRTLSGVSIVAVMTKPYECPGVCIMCPGPDSQPGNKVAQSYTGKEPAAMRSAMYNYDSYLQTYHRLKALSDIGHTIDKIELIIMGGTFLYLPDEYQKEFMKGCYDAVLNFGSDNKTRTKTIEEAIKKLETSQYRLIGITFETRPDYCLEEHVDKMLSYGATRVEIGIQSTFDNLLDLANRKHSVEDNKKAIQVAKDSGLKVNAHMMPNLPGSSPEIDYQVFQRLFNDPGFRPDMMKIYPCLVVEGTKLHQMYKEGKYVPYSEEQIRDLIVKIKSELVPNYARIQRIQRDIPANLIIDGVKHSNLRQIVKREMKKQKKECLCIRCREHGFYKINAAKEKNFNMENVKLLNLEYDASEGKEIFISFEDPHNNVLIGFLRLRIPSNKVHRNEFKNKKVAIVREVRVVGEIVHHNEKPTDDQIQHRGFGKKLVYEAEKIASKLNCEKISVIAGIGVRKYFYKLGYSLDGPYVSKTLKMV